MTTIEMPPTTYRPCAGCSAPAVSPFPATWFLDLVKEGPPQGSVGAFVTPHRPDCTLPVPEPIPGIATRIPGKYVTGLSISFTGVPLS